MAEIHQWLAAVSIVACGLSSASADDWPQFRGPGSSRVSRSLRALPVRVGTDENVLWKQPAPYETKEKFHTTGSLAQSSPATDADVVISFFGSSGLHCYDHSGRLLWSQRMGPFRNDFGAGSSPILEDNRLVLVQDHDEDSFIAVFDKLTGR